MTDAQLYLAIGVPVVFNATMMLLGFTLLGGRISDLNKRIDDLRSEMSRQFEALEKLFDEKLRRMEEVLDARLKHLEERAG